MRRYLQRVGDRWPLDRAIVGGARVADAKGALPQRERGPEWVVLLVSEAFDGIPWLERVYQAGSLWDAYEMGAPADVHCYTPDEFDRKRSTLRAVREAVELLDERLGTMQAQLEALRRTAEPIEQITKVREGIESLDEDMRGLRDSVSDLEPLLREVNARLGTLDKRIEMMRADLAPLGDLADKIPGVG